MPEGSLLSRRSPEGLQYEQTERTYSKQSAQMSDSAIRLRPARTARRHVLLLIATALAIGGCGSSPSGKGHPDYGKALAGAPAPLARLYAQGNRLLPGGVEAYEGRIAGLSGYPVVVNVWASWCGPCRFEFPDFQQVAAGYGKRVAFLGVDSQDSDDAARTFLSEQPVPYPSYTDPDQKIAESIGAGRGLPDTAFYDRAGRLVHLKQGPYSSRAELRADVEAYALAGNRDPESG
jgi:cytochrome c biogenesis protein CcmG, thiol:disulfide interchange protein DsbE